MAAAVGCASCTSAPGAAIVAPTPTAATASSPVAWDPEWQPFQPYLNELITGVQQQWERVTVESRVYPSSGTKVVVKFTLNPQGQVAEILSVDSTAGAQAEKACVMAIAGRAPYGRWTDEMVAALGQTQALTFTFFYQ